MRTLDAASVTTEELGELRGFVQALPEESKLKRTLEELGERVAEGVDVTLAAPQELLTPAQIAKLAGISRGHVYKLMDNGDLPFVRVGADRRSSMEVVAEFLQTQQVGRHDKAWRVAHPSEVRDAAIVERLKELPEAE